MDRLPIAPFLMTLAALAGAVVRGVVVDATAGYPTIIGLVAVLGTVTIAFGAVFVVVARALRIAELPAIVGLMVDSIRRPGRS